MTTNAGVACVLHDMNDPHFVLLGLRRDKPHKNDGGDGLWVLPGGGMDSPETPHEAIMRELVEEVDCRLVAPPRQLYWDWKPDAEFLMLYYTQFIPRIAVTFTVGSAREFHVLQWFDVRQLPANMWAEDRAAVERSVNLWRIE